MKKPAKLTGVQLVIACAQAAEELRKTLPTAQYMSIIIDEYPQLNTERRKIHEFMAGRRPDVKLMEQISKLTEKRKAK